MPILKAGAELKTTLAFQINLAGSATRKVTHSEIVTPTRKQRESAQRDESSRYVKKAAATRHIKDARKPSGRSDSQSGAEDDYEERGRRTYRDEYCCDDKQTSFSDDDSVIEYVRARQEDWNRHARASPPNYPAATRETRAACQV